jgi:uncharacterized protein YbjT (DUF2867 family)
MVAVLVLGGYGLLGQAIVRRLAEAGHSVVGSGRRVAVARRRWPDVEWRAADIASLVTPEAWAPLLAGIEVVVNAAGLLQPGLGDDPAAIQRRALPALYAAARGLGVRRIVQISAAGASPGASNDFLRDKAAADADLLASEVEAVVLRPGLVIAPVAYGGTALLRGLAATPWFTPLVLADSPIQTVAVDDVGEAVLIAVEGRLPAGAVLDLVETEPRTLAAVVAHFRAWLGLAAAMDVRLPILIGAAISRTADGLAWLGWRSPLRSTSMQVIRDGVTGDAAAGAQVLGRPLSSLPQTLASLPSGVQELWFARLWLLKGPIVAVLSAFWLVTGLITLADVPRAVSAGAAYGAAPPSIAVVAGAWLDIGLGLAVVVRPFARLALKGMIATTLLYIAVGTATAPDLWADPLGPLVKAVPALMLAVVGLVIAEDR